METFEDDPILVSEPKEGRKRTNLRRCCTFCCCGIVCIVLVLLLLFFVGIRREARYVLLANSTISNYDGSIVCVRSVTVSLSNDTQSQSSLPAITFLTMETEEYKSLSEVSSSVDAAHCGECGECSTEEDIDLMLQTTDTLTEDATKCAVKGLLGGDDRMEKCLKDIGFTSKCSICWKENIKCTTSKCRYTCLKDRIFSKPNNDEGGSLSACLECDEKLCGPEFIQCAGCNRRRLGIVSDIGREDEEQCDVIVDDNEQDTNIFS